MYVAGFDLSTKKVAVTVGDEEGNIEEITAYMLPDDVHKRNYVCWRIGYRIAKKYPGVYVFPERPLVWRSGTTTITLCKISGALSAGVQAGKCGEIHEVQPTSWKKDVVGNGGAKKPQIAAFLKKHWRQAYDRCFTPTPGGRKIKEDQDLIDSVCIYMFGCQVVKRMLSMQKTGVPRKRRITRKKK